MDKNESLKDKAKKAGDKLIEMGEKVSKDMNAAADKAEETLLELGDRLTPKILKKKD